MKKLNIEISFLDATIILNALCDIDSACNFESIKDYERLLQLQKHFWKMTEELKPVAKHGKVEEI